MIRRKNIKFPLTMCLKGGIIISVLIQSAYAPVAQLDRVFGYEPKGRGFESLLARHAKNRVNA